MLAIPTCLKSEVAPTHLLVYKFVSRIGYFEQSYNSQKFQQKLKLNLTRSAVEVPLAVNPTAA